MQAASRATNEVNVGNLDLLVVLCEGALLGAASPPGSKVLPSFSQVITSVVCVVLVHRPDADIVAPGLVENTLSDFELRGRAFAQCSHQRPSEPVLERRHLIFSERVQSRRRSHRPVLIARVDECGQRVEPLRLLFDQLFGCPVLVQ